MAENILAPVKIYILHTNFSYLFRYSYDMPDVGFGYEKGFDKGPVVSGSIENEGDVSLCRGVGVEQNIRLPRVHRHIQIVPSPALRVHC